MLTDIQISCSDGQTLLADSSVTLVELYWAKAMIAQWCGFFHGK